MSLDNELYILKLTPDCWSEEQKTDKILVTACAVHFHGIYAQMAVLLFGGKLSKMLLA
jgi:hypothetical protein